jgi:hypothetical protein
MIIALQASFDDVLLTEKLDEGLVMLRHELNWDLADLMYLPVRTSSVADRVNTPFTSAVLPRRTAAQVATLQALKHTHPVPTRDV